MTTAQTVTPDGRIEFDLDRAIDRLMRFLSVEGITGEEAKIGKEVTDALVKAGVRRRGIKLDDANKRIPLPTQTGNLIVKLAATRPGKPRMLMTHLDTVPLCAGAKPARKGNKIVAAGETALGADNRTGVACLVTVAATIIEQKIPHPGLTLLFTVREESGLWGARYLDPTDLGRPDEAFNVDGGSAAELTIGAVGAERWEAEISGRASHAGVHPERGVSASLVAALALADVHRNGWFGKIRKNGHEGTSNVGSIGDAQGRSAGMATNVVTDFALVRGEARSHDPQFVKSITAAYREAFDEAAERVRDDRGRGAQIRFKTRADYYPFRLEPTEPVVRHAMAAARAIGLHPTLKVSNGGLDANWMVRHGIPTVTFGAGQNNPHTIGEFVDLREFEAACKLALALATQPEM
jgi:tripeptide aminopeptidase